MYIIVLNTCGNHENRFHFLDPKPNMILPGTFTKVSYSHDQYTLNNIFFHFPVQIKTSHTPVHEHPQKHEDHYIVFDTTDETNHASLERFSQLEEHILNSYYEYHQTMKKPVHTIQKQLLSGNCKIHGRPSSNIGGSSYIMKISGIWESDTEYGITFRILTSSPEPFPS